MSIMMETMGRKKARRRRSFTREFKAEVAALVRQPGNSAASVARDLDLTETAVRAWVKQADINDGNHEGLTSAQLAELAQLRRENRVLREERDILRRATAFFARETR
jgi:transposase